MFKYIIIAVFLLIIAIAVSLYIISKNRFKFKQIKIEEALNQITSLLNDKFEALKKVNEIIKGKTNEDFLANIEDVKVEELDMFDMTNCMTFSTYRYDVDIIELTEFNKDIKLEESDIEELDKLTKINIDCNAAEEYYNDNVESYNKLINKFPYSVVAKMNKHKKKDLFVSQKEEMFEILKK